MTTSFIFDRAAAAVELSATAFDLFMVQGGGRWASFQSTLSEQTDTFGATVFINGDVLCGNFDAIWLRSSDVAAADRLTVGTTGQVHAFGGSGVQMDGHDAQLSNDGNISGDIGVEMSGLFVTVENTGTIRGDVGAGLQLTDSNSAAVFNSGLITGAMGIELVNAYVSLQNSGTVRATDPAQSAINLGLAVGACVIRNTGLIEAAESAIFGSVSGDTVVNGGTILGSVALEDSDDEFRGRQGWLDGNLYGGNGNDRLSSGIGDDNVQGDGGKDTLRGNAGEDALYGGSGADLLRGDEGDDTLTGGGGADVFVLTRGGGDDRIDDFANGQDRIDVSAFHLPDFATLATLAADRVGGMLIDLTTLGGGTVLVAGLTTAGFDAGDAIL